jgi:hypothetical protein
MHDSTVPFPSLDAASVAKRTGILLVTGSSYAGVKVDQKKEAIV